MDDLRREEALRQWIIRIGAGLVGALVVGALVIGYLVLELKSTQHQITKDEHATCIVQARGLPAAHHLSASMRDINVFLNIKGGQEPPRTIHGAFNPIFFALMNLRQELPKYVALTAKQPATRDCS